ncbi:2-dehydro-3-deoxy-6-phosphogalactonate aldolase [Escherichia coli]|uniref:2-dehydro-3-deoxy-6-phosphogalactonate aldolase n=1 Tax=Escherichia coli TaxID=562 RepID=UPI000E6824CC|nr:2-dehydro-3-deoxy-6-phosphogalactonate aldolase [Escherichia coli]MCB3584253.1 2-dehydro-3-deoxy-6-phosphogalactonate aldolase [Klebsiella pneumoniae]MCB3612287.1 2-dehydro-3-deoxy-6-phosphogalactonate aldolase [Klebsiella pneumoniae]RIW06386.1 2-dehydro-3-deoxy-6-phosphogalactonate aldolase [Escherichia coli]HBZ1364742.1 2-dehydro-3-deoxy-6-phosphogalactonate aldolase [Klebsiella pneumoniae]HCB0391693.1 2-dehydro-3-deoxy-6-phosphogalactonate aldolase [Klebsiella pneumoniae]
MKWETDVPLIAILRGIKPDEVLEHVEILLEAGFTAIEIPTNSPDWQLSIARVVSQYGNKGLFGAGTVLYPEQVDELARLGGQLVVTPNTRSQVIRKGRERGMIVCAGCATATEAFTALENGAQILKIFPSSSFGPDYIKALKAVLPADIPIMAVGGVTADNLSSWIRAGCTGAGLGGDLYRAGQSVEYTQVQAQAFIQAWHNT